MVRINDNNAKYLPPETLFELSTQVFVWTEEYPIIKTKTLAIINNLLKPSHLKLDVCVKNIRGSKHTAVLVVKDKRRDNTRLSIDHIVKANLLSSDPKRRDAAELITRLLKAYKDLNRKEYNKQTGSTRNLIQEFRGAEYKDAAEEIDLNYWIDDLEDANNDFAATMDARTTQSSEKTTYNTKEVCGEFCDALNMFFNYLNGLVVIDGNTEYEAAFKKMNAILEQFAVKSKKSSGSNSTTTSEPAVDYPDAKEWEEDLPFMGVENGDIYYILVDGKKVFYKLVDKSSFFDSPDSAKGESGWEKL